MQALAHKIARLKDEGMIFYYISTNKFIIICYLDPPRRTGGLQLNEYEHHKHLFRPQQSRLSTGG